MVMMKIRIQSRHVWQGILLFVVICFLIQHYALVTLSKSSLAPPSSQIHKNSHWHSRRQQKEQQHRPPLVNDLPVMRNKLPNFNLTGLLFSAPTRPRPKHPPPMKLPTPVIVVGLPKAGTSSLFSFFHCNGYNTQHWYCCHPQNDPRRIDASHYNNKTTTTISDQNTVKTPKLMAECLLHNMALNHQKNHSQPRRLFFEGCGNYEVYTEINGPRPRKRRTPTVPGVSVSGHSATTATNRHGGNSRNSTHPSTLGATTTTSTTEIVGVQLDNGSYDLSPPFDRIFLPQHFQLEQIHEQFPRATFLLNQRPVASWVASVLDWERHSRAQLQRSEFQTTEKIYPKESSSTWRISDLAMELANELKQVYHKNQRQRGQQLRSSSSNHPFTIMPPRNYSRSGLEQFLSTLYRTHEQVIRNFVQRHPSHALVEIDITSDTAGQQLANAFGVQYADCWTHRNRNKRKNKIGSSKT
jgi:hypothetical protein